MILYAELGFSFLCVIAVCTAMSYGVSKVLLYVISKRQETTPVKPLTDVE